MGNYLNVGNAGFQSVRKGCYVDKTGLISFINGTLGSPNKLTCVSRARRFGKSVAVKMLCAYYDRSCDSKALFEGLEIAGDISFEKYLNRYDVIYLDITLLISACGDIENLTAYLQKQVIREIADAYPEAAGETSLPMALAKASGESGQKFIIIIDEWDALFREAKGNTRLQREYIWLLRGLFKSSLTDKMIEAAYITGILPIKKYGTQSAVSDFREYTMVDPGCLAEYVGFMEPEVRKLCLQYGMDYREAERWYDGYYFSGVGAIYNPSSVMEAMQRKKYKGYWARTETYESLKIYIDMDYEGLKEAVMQMLGGARCVVDTDTFQNDMTSIGGKDDVLTLMVHLGYLAYDESCSAVYIPNEEIRREFVRVIKYSSHTEIANMVRTTDELLQDTLGMNERKVAAAIEKVHRISTSPLYYNNEQALRSVIRFAYISCMEQFQEIQELPSGVGYADVVYLPKRCSAMPVMVVELKWNKGAGGAIQQIKLNKYPEVLEGYGSDILLVGISYDEKTKKHQCAIEKYQKMKDI